MVQPVSWQFDAIGTHWVIELFAGQFYGPMVIKRVASRIEQFDKHYSRFRDDSLIHEMSQTAGTYALPPDARAMFGMYQLLYGATDGTVTPLIGQALNDAGYDSAYSLTPRPIRPVPKWEDVLVYEWPHLTLSEPAMLDVGALGKGHLIDILGRLLKRLGVTAFCINAGGDIVCHGDDRIDVALEHPDDPSQAVGVAHLRNNALCGSSGNRRSWAGYHHIINPHHRASPRHIKAVWVVAETAIVADGISTALFFTPAEHLQRYFDFDYAIIHADTSLTRSAKFPGEFFVQ